MCFKKNSATLNLFNFKQLIKSPTRTTDTVSSIIDHILCNNTEKISQSGGIPCGLTDHDPIFCTCKTETVKQTYNCHKIVIPQFHPFRSSAYRFRDKHFFTQNGQNHSFSRSHDPKWNFPVRYFFFRRWSQNFVRFALALTVFESALFQGHMTKNEIFPSDTLFLGWS